MSGGTMPSEPRPEYDALVNDLRALVRDQRIVEARATGAEVMRRAEMLFKAGKLSADDHVRLASLRLRLDTALPLPEGRRPWTPTSPPRSPPWRHR